MLKAGVKLDLKRFGVMQGRLLSPEGGRYQAHPVGRWQEEFELAGKIGFGYIEFVVDHWSLAQNPFSSTDGLKEIQRVIDSSGVYVKTLCADALMEWPLHSKNLSEADHASSLLVDLIRSTRTIEGSVVVLPCVDRSSLRMEDFESFVKRLKPICEVGLELGVKVALESDLPPEEFMSLLEHFETGEIWVNYDIGNSASLGFNPQLEFGLYGNVVADVHVKDRKLGGGSVPLGAGDADLETAMSQLHYLNYEGPIVFQAWRGDLGWDDLEPQMAHFEEIMRRVEAK